jgi:anaerobic ribonucleoside-triphosphate reductase
MKMNPDVYEYMINRGHTDNATMMNALDALIDYVSEIAKNNPNVMNRAIWRKTIGDATELTGVDGE